MLNGLDTLYEPALTFSAVASAPSTLSVLTSVDKEPRDT